jgi:hypothetical protein
MANENEEVQEGASQEQDQAQSNENEQVVVDQGQAEQQPVEEATPEEKASQIDHIMAMAAKDPSIKDLPEYQDMLKEMEAIDSKTQAKTENEESEGESNEEESSEDNEEEDDVAEDLSEEDDVFGLSKNKKKTKYKFKDEKDVVDLIKKKGFKEVPTFFESVDKWRNDSQELVDVRTQNDQLVEGLGSLPQPIKTAIQAFSQNEDWQSAFQNSSSSLNFDANFEELDKEAVVKHYFKDRYQKLKERLDDERIDEEDYEERISDFHESSKRLFETDKQTVEKKRAALVEQEKVQQEKFKTSALSSVKALKEEYPNFNASQLQKIRQHLVNGDVNSLFMSSDGYQDDAAERIAFALYGKKILKAKINQAEKTGKSKAKEEYFERGNKTPRTSSSQQGYSNNSAKEAASHLQGQFKDDPYA